MKTDAKARAKQQRAHDALAYAISTNVRNRLRSYEESGCHDHGRGPIKPGGACPGGDCLVAKARAMLAMVWP